MNSTNSKTVLADSWSITACFAVKILHAIITVTGTNNTIPEKK
jgi:hypothetical protein